ncbi:complement receptor type 2-like [Liasis olivaceus]
MSSATSFIVITETGTGAMISACTLSLLFAAAFLAAPLEKQDSCGYPPRLFSAELMDEYKEKDYFPVGSTVKYKCRPGYVKAPGNYTSTCHRNQQWSEVLEPCQRKSCGYPGEPVGGRLLVNEGFLFGSTANYQCEEGYKLIGKSSRKCIISHNKVVWTGDLPHCAIIQCFPPPNIPHGKHTGKHLQDFSYGTAVTYTCDKGYPLIGNASIYCTTKDGTNGEWSGHVYCGVTQCPSPQIKNGRIVAGISSNYRYNQKVSFECIGGHKMVGSREIHCQVDGTWDPPVPLCEQVSGCVTPDIQNGRIIRSKGTNQTLSTITFECDHGYTMKGNCTIQCQHDNTWDFPAPICVRVLQCQPPPDIQNGTRSNQERTGFPSGMLVKYTCNPGYALIGEATIHCMDDGRWSSPAPNCEGGNCDSPIRLDFAELTDGYKKMNSFPVGSSVKYKCHPGYVKHPGMNASATCLRNQVWSEVQEFCKKKSCGHPGEPENSRLIVSGDFLFGSTLSYTCEEGHKLIGQSSRQCVISGKKVEWSGVPPKCQRILCSSPPTIPHGKHTGKYLEDFSYGTAVTYTCDKGYPLIGNASIYCTTKDGINGEWSGRAYCGVKQCPSPQIKNGRIVAGISSTYRYNQKVSFECIGGHKMVGSRDIHCQVDGTWDPPVPLCEQGGTCGPPIVLDWADIADEYKQIKSFLLGSTVKYICHPGYVRNPELKATVTCIGNQVWSKIQEFCQRKSCGHPGELAGGRLLVTDYLFGSTVNYQCEEGYRLIGKSSRRCALFGETVAWTDELPYCQMKQCPSPQIKNGRIVAGISSTYRYNQKVSFECIGGHKMVGSRDIHCQVDGMWNPPVPLCEQESQCPSPPSIANGKHDGLALQMFTSETSVTYSCDPGYLLFGRSSITCTPSGNWSLPVPSCEVMHCPPPPKITHGKHFGEDFTYGKSVTYICDAGYSPIGNYSITCIWNSSNSVKWSEGPRCQGCLAPQGIAHGKHDKAILEEFPYGSSVTYHCDPGYSLTGAPTIYCQTSGTWDQPVPQCKRRELATSCVTPGIHNGKIRSQEVIKSTVTITFECNPGYILKGNRTIHCQPDNTWDSPVPICVREVECKAPPNIQNGAHSDQEVAVFKRGMCVKYTCNLGYTLIGDATIHCTDSGTWTFPVPHCEKSQCPFPPSIANGKHDGLALQMFTSESSVTYSCDLGYLLIGKSSITCTPSGNWSLPVPSCEVMHCPPPPKITHGKHFGEDFTYGKSVIYICDAGYSPIGNYSITCIWNSSNSVKWSEGPRCQGCLAPQGIAHGKHDKAILEEFPYGSSVTYHCDPGYSLTGAPTIYCQTSGTWDQPVPQCKRREYMAATELPDDSRMTKDENNQIKKITRSFRKNTTPSEINKITTKVLATTLTPGLRAKPDVQRLPEQLNDGNQTEHQKDALPEGRHSNGEVVGCTLPQLSDSEKAETETVIQIGANVTLECENGYDRNGPSPIRSQQMGLDAPMPVCTASKQSSYNFTVVFGK